MDQALAAILDHYRQSAKTEREKGTYFERLCVAYLKNDPLQTAQYDEVWPFSDWAQARGIDRRDTGIDLVARMRDSGGYCAIQCKFYDEDKRISKSEIDSFFTASGKAPFARRLIIDTTDAEWSEHAEAALRDQQIETMRVGLSDLSASAIDWSVYQRDERVVLAPKKVPFPYQAEALDEVEAGLETADRGKLLMACGTGKTFTALKIAERMAGKGKRVLFLVPSLALMSQTVREWTIDTQTPLRAFAVCSDSQVGKRRASEDVADLEIHDLAFPATTDPRKLAQKFDHETPDEMTVIFSTYQSIQVISDAQQRHGLPDFDLIICDEAHRTTGATFADGEESNFVKVHRQEFIRGNKRLYMTATPRIYGDGVKTKAAEASVEICSMDDEELYGAVLFQRGFSWAVQNGLLTDYKVIVLAVDEQMVSSSVQRRLMDADSSLLLDDATKIIGCYKALTKIDLKPDVLSDPHPMRRAIAFCKDIKSSKLITGEFASVVNEYLGNVELAEGETALNCELNHVDGTFNAKSRTTLLDWLKDEAEENTCRILSNARCLSEGVDVPALDAIMFLHPRKSQIDVVQSVGRVMRRAEGKKMGYVILPVGIPAGMSPEEALNNNEKYKVVWQILNALRAHDDRFDATINKMELGADVSAQIEIIAVTNDMPQQAAKAEAAGIGSAGRHSDEDYIEGPLIARDVATQTAFVFDEFATAVMAKIVKKCGRRTYWEDWAGDIAKIAQTHITRIKALVEQPGTKERAAFESFVAELRDDLNDSITEDEAIEMLAQHLITKPVFDALFEGHSFTSENPVSKAMQSVLNVLEEQNIEKESQSLQKFYDSVRFRASGIDNAEGKQRIVVELYDKFFSKAFPRLREKLGIVYTPVEVVDFIIHSVNEVLQSEFGTTIGSKGVHIIDPFTGTGTFITRLLQSGLIKPEELEHKFRHEIHANEIVLLAYYIAAINIEAVFHDLSERDDYVPFEGICLTDTFQMYEGEDLVAQLMPDNSDRRKRQKELDLRVIIGNPPYSAGQTSANDDAANVIYPTLDARIRDTYAAHTSMTNKRAIYDSYIRAIRWGSDRLKSSGGVMAYVSNAGWVDGAALDGLRKCLREEFSSLHVFHLRGNARTSGEQRRREKGNVFGEGTRTPIAISIFTKNPSADKHGEIFFHDIGDYLDQKQKLAIIKDFGSIGGVNRSNAWSRVEPDEHNDWIDQRAKGFAKYNSITAKGGDSTGIFETHSAGLKTNRDVWVYDFSRSALERRVRASIDFFNSEIDRAGGEKGYKPDPNPTRFKWCQATLKNFERSVKLQYHPEAVQEAMYRPFQRMWVYKHQSLNWSSYLMPRFFPKSDTKNVAICLSGPGGRGQFSALVVNAVPSIHFADVDGAQCFPLALFTEKGDDVAAELFSSANEFHPNSGITDQGLRNFKNAYMGEEISKEDIFYYVYGLLHSEAYRTSFADNLSKELPRIPKVKKAEDFWAFTGAGRALADLHVNFETVAPYPTTIKQGDLRLANIPDPNKFYRVEKMKFGGTRPGLDKSTVVYNANITMTGIPLEAYDYVVNGKPALEWVMERQAVVKDTYNPTTKKGSDIVNDANCYAIETVGNPAYPLELFQRVITVSLETMKIVRSLPALDID
ncbi:DEAD/DEAH box helicase [Devosia aquimaris]|uniref:DEAD/DEAH box helicase n=1 Tax=Devosia aquimaris TaxID=2866214 RepID=UPI001CD06CD6|nr:type ISP restriction/modification enzyme [Devosia sp. CJK-A8-3]